MSFFPDVPILQNAVVVLASGSPRRRELLARLMPAERFTVFPVDLDESVLPDEAPAIYVERLALEKARAGANLWQTRDFFTNEQTLIIGSDTTVALANQIYGKPDGAAGAAEMLRALSGNTHTVITGIAAVLLDPSGHITTEKSTIETSYVTFRELSPSEIDWYVATGESLDKAGGYAIQGYGGVFIKAIQGDYSNIVGFPLSPFVDLLRSL